MTLLEGAVAGAVGQTGCRLVWPSMAYPVYACVRHVLAVRLMPPLASENCEGEGHSAIPVCLVTYANSLGNCAVRERIPADSTPTTCYHGSVLVEGFVTANHLTKRVVTSVTFLCWR